jgi:excisionase family DNA binding protein
MDELSSAEIAEVLNLSQHTVSELCRRQHLPGVKRAGRWFVRRSVVTRFAKLDRPSGPKKTV